MVRMFFSFINFIIPVFTRSDLFLDVSLLLLIVMALSIFISIVRGILCLR